MLVSLYGISTLASVFKLVLLLLVFFLLLIAAHCFTKWYAKSGYVNARTANISILESQQLSQGKNIIIAKIGNKYVSFLLLKDNAVLLTELKEEELTITAPPETSGKSFKDILMKVKDNK